jgi:MoaA/NifB/PqqE/SkfB family radical SAM enzyme
MSANTADLVARYKYSAQYVADYEEFRRQVLDKTVIPYQVEFQPSPRSPKKICWLECPYCYGLAADDNGDRLSDERGIEIMRQIAAGGVKKVIFAGYATDPLNSPYLEDLLEIAIDNQMVFGFNTKALKVSKRLLELLARPDIVPTSYMSLSVDAGSNDVYRTIHAVTSKAKLYDRVLNNVRQITEARSKGGGDFDVSAAYLVNIHSHEEPEVAGFIDDFQGAGCDLLRFTFPQPPRGIKTEPGVVPDDDDCARYRRKLEPLISARSSDSCPTLLVDADTEHQIFRKPRTVPCFARFIYPTVGFDGWLYHCSQSSAPNFRAMALGNLKEHDFWELFYNYDASRLGPYFGSCSKTMAKTGCRCDRKEHIVNSGVIESGVFHDVVASE